MSVCYICLLLQEIDGKPPSAKRQRPPTLQLDEKHERPNAEHSKEPTVNVVNRETGRVVGGMCFAFTCSFGTRSCSCRFQERLRQD